MPSSPPLDDALAPPTLAATGDPHRLYLRWARVPDALFYEAELRAPDGSRAAGRMVDAREEEASFSRHLLPLFAGESYQARVRALAEGSRGAWSRVQPVALAAEADAAGEAVEDFAALLPAPLLQAYYEAGSAVLRYTSVAGADAYEAQLLTAAGTVAAERAPPAGELTATFPAAEYGLQQGQTYQARVRGTAAGGVLGRWSISQPVTVQDLAAPAASPTFAGGTLFADVAAAVPGAQFYAFRATSVVDGREEVVDEAFAAPSGLPVAFAAPFADGVTCAVAAQAVAGSVLGAWSAPAPITVAVLAVPALRLGFAAPDVVAAWDPVGELTGYEFELWTTGGTPRRLDHRALTQPPYTVRVSQGIREDGVYLGRVRSQAGLNSSAWSQAEVRASVLDPLLQALRERLEAAWHAGSGAELPIDAATLGEPGAAVVGLMQGGFGAPELVVTGTVGLAADPVLDTVTVTGSSRDTVLGVDDAAVTVVFRASGAEIVADFDVYVGVGWDLGVSFPLLAQTVLARLSWDDSEAGSPAFVLSSLGAPASGDRGAVSPGLNLAGRLLLEGPAAPLLALVPAAPDPLPVTGAVHTDGGGLRFDLAGAVPAVTLAALPGLGPLAFGAPRFVVHAASNPNAVACALWVAADVGVGGVVLPLAVQLPQGGTGWAVLLLPGRGVPVADLGALLGFVTGTSVLQALPADVRHLTSLQLNQFRIALDPDFTGFRSLTLAVGSTSGTVGPLWSPLPGVLDLTTLSASLLVARDADGGLAASGRISGAVVLGGRLRLGADVALPLGTGDWVFTAGTGTPLADLGAFDALVGGSTSFAGVLPGGLGALRQFTVGSLRLVVDPTGPRLRRVSLNLFSNAEWHLVEDAVVLTSLATDLTLEDPTLATRQLTGTVSGAMRVGSVAVQAVVERAAAGSPWTLTVTTDRVRLPSLGDLARLVGGEGAAALLPATLAGASFSLWDIVLEVDLSERALRRFSFALATADTWILLAPDLLTAGEVSVFLALDWTSGARRTTGSIQGTLGLAGASLMIAATYAAEAWTIEADMAPPGPDGTGALSFSGALAQLGIGGSHLLPRDVGLPALTMTSGHLRFVPSTGELELSAGSALGWPVPFGTGARPLQVATLGGSVHRLPGGAGWSARVTGSLAYGGIGAVVGVALGGPGTDTVIEAAMGTLAAADVPQLADGLAATSPADGWSTLAFPPDFPGLGLTQAHLRLDLTRKTLLVYGTAAPFGTGVFVVQQAAGGGWEAALGLNLSSGGAPWSLGQLSQGLAPASAFFAIDQARAALAISTVDGQALAPIVGVVPELARALPGTVRRGANFFGELHFAGPVVGNVPRILGTDPGTTVTLLALIAARSDESLFEVRLDRYPLVGGVTFSDVLLRYRPGTSPALALHGTVTVPLDGRDHAFTGDLQVLAASASFRLATAQSAAAPLGMTGITLTGLALAIDYAFPEAQPATVSVVLSGGVAIGGVASLTGLVYLLDGIPVIAEVLAARLGVTDLFQQSVGVQWPESLVPLELLSASVYCYRPADPDDHSPLAFRGRTYFPGFNVAAHVVFLGRPATLTLAVAPGQGVTATGALDAPVDWGFVVFSGGAQRTGPSAALATYPQATLTLTAGFTLFDLYVGVVAFALSRDASSGEMVGTVSFTRDLPVFGTRTLVVSWSESGGFRFEGFPVELPAKFVIPEITSRSAGCLGKQILQALPVDTRYDFDTDFSISDGALVIGLQGYFALTTLKLEVLRIDLQRLTITVPVPTGGEEPFRWSDVPEWIARTLAENAYSLLVQVLADPASLAKLLAIEGVKYAVSALVDALVCEDPAKWGRGTAQSFVEGATSAFPTPVVVGGVPVVVGGIGVVVGPGGAVAVGSGPNPPAPPAPPVGLTMSYTGDMLHLGWGLVSGATSYAFRLTDSAGRVAAQRSNLGGTSASVPREQLTWGETYTFTVLPNNGGVLGGSATASYPVPTPRGTADGLASGGTRVESAGAALREVFPSLDAGVMAATLQGAYGATDPAAWATPTAAALRNAGFDREAAHGALSAVFPGITREQLAAAMQAAYSLDPAQLAEYLARLGFPFTETAAILASAFTPRQGPAAVAALLRASYSGLGAADLVAALAAARFAPAETARATAGEVPSTTAAEMAGYLAAAYTSPAITPEEVAAALVAAFPGTVALEVARALRGAFAQPPIGPAEVARALVAAFTQPAITAAEAAPALAAAFGYPASVDAAAIAAALVVGFAARPIAPAEAAAALLALAPAPEAPAVARALVAAFTTPALTPLQAAQALVAAFTAPAPITTARVAEALVAAFTAPVPIDPAGVAAALAAAFPAPPITAAALAEALARAFPAATEPQVAVALVAGLPGASEAEVAGALVSVFAGTTPGAVALALATAFPATTPAAVAAALRAVFTLPAIEPPAVAVALVAGFVSPAPVTPPQLVAALQSAFAEPAITPGGMAAALVAALARPEPVTPERVAELLAGSFVPAPAPAEVAVALVAAFAGPQPVAPARVAAALLAAYPAAPPGPTEVALALVAAFRQPAPITPPEVAATLRGAAFPAPATPAQTAVALAAAFPAIDPAGVVAALFAAFAEPRPTPDVIAGALVAAFPRAIDAATLARTLAAAYAEPPVTPEQVAAALVAAMVDPPVAASAVAGALQEAFPGPPPVSMGAAASALVGAWPAARPLTPADAAAALLAGWKPAPAAAELAVALVAAFARPVPITPEQVAAALVASVGAAATPDAVATALVAAFAAPEPITPEATVRALVATPFPAAVTPAVAARALAAAFTQPAPITPLAVGQALHAMFGAAAAPPVLAAALAGAFPQATPSAVAQALAALFTSPAPITPAETAAALALAFPGIAPAAALQALFDAYVSPALTPVQGAAALVAVFTQPAHVSMAEVARALVAVFTTPAPVTPRQVAAALVQAFAAPVSASAVAAALVAAFTRPRPITSGEVAAALRGAFTAPPIEAPGTATALVAAFTQPAPISPAEVVAALQQAFADPPLAAADAARSVAAAFTSPAPITAAEVAAALVARFPGLTPAGCVQALQAAFAALGFPPAQAAIALVAAFTSPAITAPEVAAALRQAYPELTASGAAGALVAAFTGPAITAPAVATALAAAFPAETPASVAVALVAALVAPPVSPEGVAAALQAAFAGVGLAEVAAALAAAFTTPAAITPTAVAAALVATFPPETAGIRGVAAAVDGAFPGIGARGVAVALAGAFAGATPAAVGRALHEALAADAPSVAVALTAAFPGLTAAALAQALAATFGGIDLPALALALRAAYPAMGAIEMAPVLGAALPSVTVAQLAAALVAAWGYTIADLGDLLIALEVGFPRPLDADVAAAAVTSALKLTEADTDTLASTIARQFSLGRPPVEVAAMGVALRAAGVRIIPAAKALSLVYPLGGWTAGAFARLLSVYTAPEWELAALGKARGEALAAVAAQIRAQLPGLSAAQMTLVLASAFFHTRTRSGAVEPVGRGMKAAAYSLVDAAAAMGAFYPEWRAGDYAILQKVYDEPAA